jgi:hypothetical protein
MKRFDLPLKVGRALGALTVLSLSVSACGSAGDSPDVTAPESAPGAEQVDESAQDDPMLTTEVLNEFSIGEHSFSFRRLGRDEANGEPGTVALVETYHAQDYLTALREQYGELTLLEVFHAFAPEGEQPDPALVTSHAYEAQVLSRAEPSVVKRVDGRELRVEKDTGQSCPTGTGLLPPIAPLVYTSKQAFLVNITDTEIYLCTGNPQKSGVGTPSGCTQHSQSKYQVAAACIHSSNRDRASAWFFLNGTRGARNFLDPGWFVRAQLTPVANPGPIGRSFAVSMKQGPTIPSSGCLYSGVGEAP